jgi:hypothetical protein
MDQQQIRSTVFNSVYIDNTKINLSPSNKKRSFSSPAKVNRHFGRTKAIRIRVQKVSHARNQQGADSLLLVSCLISCATYTMPEIVKFKIIYRHDRGKLILIENICFVLFIVRALLCYACNVSSISKLIFV